MAGQIHVRDATSEDASHMDRVLKAAFETDAEAKIVEALRRDGASTISCVAQVDEAVVGCVVFSPVHLEDHPELAALGLAPVAVDPRHQTRGIGARMIDAGLDRCRESGAAAVFVLGQPDYYTRFGFQNASDFGIDSEYQVPAGYFMVLELKAGTLNRTHGGTARYLPVFQMV
ncbi:MAG: N-acetyltransferase [Pseudomonadota bacterium]